MLQADARAREGLLAGEAADRPAHAIRSRTLRLSSTVIQAPPLTVWPTVERRCRLPSDVEAFVGDSRLRIPDRDRHD